jgi:hypothetical protein
MLSRLGLKVRRLPAVPRARLSTASAEWESVRTQALDDLRSRGMAEADLNRLASNAAELSLRLNPAAAGMGLPPAAAAAAAAAGYDALCCSFGLLLVCIIGEVLQWKIASVAVLPVIAGVG